MREGEYIEINGRTYRKMCIDNTADKYVNRGIERMMLSNRSQLGRGIMREPRMTRTRNGNIVERVAR